MDLKGAVMKYMNDAIKNAPVDPELKRAAQANHRFAGFAGRLYGEILEVEKHRLKNGKQRLQGRTVKWIVQEFVHTYLRGVQTEALRRAESDIARIMREKAEQHKIDLEASTGDDGKFVGEFAELQEGLTLSDERDVE